MKKPLLRSSNVYNQFFTSPCGVLEVVADDRGVTAVRFVEHQPDRSCESPITQRTCTQLQEYFSGARHSFDVPLAAKGTDFQERVWQQLTRIQYGHTASYADIANCIDNPTAVRAVGMANGRNPIAIIVPCHRVIGSNGTLTGYAGGLARKQFLLELEGAIS
ncbi:methylated-DNA--[protein]-cysteine S-methyltransferase [Alteromonas aestuariivivens]|uniref:Methylated-DNA--protein-cysteine methyltransferase n=1 Tax=Alteromonas aestuariivivens TaxID=1938339 RepID=A0A3D8MA27_9ALTE|nr:methylated-DNA--[protein]-cysteine S-methyltransferase [Alteromonas aestuariivivens]RDV26836.1 methylated-DNA--[protein]-cysteine S-methyltransferase [Alteromonas aestuariivivens]